MRQNIHAETRYDHAQLAELAATGIDRPGRIAMGALKAMGAALRALEARQPGQLTGRLPEIANRSELPGSLDLEDRGLLCRAYRFKLCAQEDPAGTPPHLAASDQSDAQPAPSSPGAGLTSTLADAGSMDQPHGQAQEETQEDTRALDLEEAVDLEPEDPWEPATDETQESVAAWARAALGDRTAAQHFERLLEEVVELGVTLGVPVERMHAVVGVAHARGHRNFDRRQIAADEIGDCDIVLKTIADVLDLSQQACLNHKMAENRDRSPAEIAARERDKERWGMPTR
jgi:hypothetical protein